MRALLRSPLVILILFIAVVIALLAIAAGPAPAQVRYGVLGDQPYTLLAERYDPREKRPVSVFCFGPDVRREVVPFDARDRFVLPLALVPALITGADTVIAVTTSGDSTSRVEERFVCPSSSAVAHFHRFGNCNPSRDDYEQLVREGSEFGVIYCGVPRFYWREEAQAMLAPPLQVRHAGVGAPPRGLPGDRGRAARRRDLYYASLTLGVGAVRVFRLDPVTEGDTRWRIQDQGFHVAAGFAIASAAMRADVRPRDAVLGVCGATTALEYMKGEPSWRDMVAGCVGGAGLAWLWNKAWP